MRFRADRWAGNHWASIDLEPVDLELFLPVLNFLVSIYDISLPGILWDVDGYSADFELLGSKAILSVDTFTFSAAFELDAVRDQVLSLFQSLPLDYFEAPLEF
jgi:hypothetical protein